MSRSRSKEIDGEAERQREREREEREKRNRLKHPGEESSVWRTPSIQHSQNQTARPEPTEAVRADPARGAIDRHMSGRQELVMQEPSTR